jgi:hypothetical protein
VCDVMHRRGRLDHVRRIFAVRSVVSSV